ncbi:MAG TPA: hypothetical protein PK530_09070 [Anaerolineales bacterium]|nr:hypothetical protein [Anaerolineales bacterium]
MKKTGKCPKCESRNILGNVPIDDNTYGGILPLSIRILKKPKALLFQKPVKRTLVAWICTDCGYTELYTHDPKALMAAFRENQANQ